MLILAAVPCAAAATTVPCSSDWGSGWSTGGGGGFAFTCGGAEGTPSPYTGPSAGVGGSGAYYFAEVNSPRKGGDYFTLTYDGSACSVDGEGVSLVTFYYHMHGSNMGTLLVINAAEEAVWSLSGNQGDLWTEVTVAVHSPSRRRSASSIYTRGNGWEGDAALA